MWSDPEEIDNWQISPRGAGWLFGSRVTAEVRSKTKKIRKILIESARALILIITSTLYCTDFLLIFP